MNCEFIVVILQFLVIVAISPLMSGLVSKFKALMQGRRGSSIFQPYHDISKLLRKNSVTSRSCSWLFRVIPYVCMVSMIGLAMMVPFFYTGILAPVGGLIAAVYLMTMFRFAMVLGGLEGGSTFGGMGSSREMMFSVLVEPALLLSIATLAVLTESGTNMGDISNVIVTLGLTAIGPSLILAGVSFIITMLAENSRIPFDNPTTHLELTMIHEAMLLEYSGRGLAFMELSSMIRLTVFMALLSSMFFPWGISLTIEPCSLIIGVIVVAIKMVLVAFLISVIESVLCKSRLFKAPNLLTVSFALSLLAMIALYIL